MSKYLFALSNLTSRQEGIVEGPTFDAALQGLAEHVTVQAGDRLEIGVFGFPPAHYECVGQTLGEPLWIPANRLAA